MEVLLLQDIPNVGKKNDLLVVGDGYAMNNLLPNRKALVATPTVRRRYADLIKKRAVERQQEQEMKATTAGKLSGVEVQFSRKATKTGKLYAAITEKHISEALAKDHALDVPETAITIAEPIKSLGSFPVAITLGDTSESVTVVVAEEK